MSNNTLNYDIVIIGGGPAGLSAAYNANLAGAGKILVIERDRELGGILQQCIHNGFGLQLFKEELTGPAYTEKWLDLVQGQENIEFLVDTMVLDMQEDKTIIACNPTQGLLEIKAKAIVMAMGCRERTRGAIRISGTRPAGVFTAGAAQRMVNMDGALPGKTAVILGSGDIGLVMARRLTLEGVKVLACIELMPYSNGLTRNIVQCLEDFDIPLYLSHTIAKIHGEERVTGITCTKVDEKMQPIAGSDFFIECDTVLLSVGLIPENELSCKINIPIDKITSGPIVDQYRQTLKEGFFAAGNVVHVHDLADFASDEAAIAGKSAALYVKNQLPKSKKTVLVKAGDGIRTVVPQHITLTDSTDGNEDIRLFLRANQPQQKVQLEITSGDEVLTTRPLTAAIPSEMIIATIKAKDIAKIQDEVVISLRR